VRLSEIIRLVWININENKFKVILTSLGIIVGAATIVMVIAIGRGGQLDVEDQFKNLSAGAIEVTYKSSNDTGGMPMGAMMPPPGGFGGTQGRTGGSSNRSFNNSFASPFAQTVTLSESDVEDIELFVPDISAATITANTKSTIAGGILEEDTKFTVAGVKPEYQSISNLEMAVGDFITEEQELNGDKVAVIGSKVAEQVFGSAAEAYDNSFTIDGRTYTVTGVLKTMGTVSSGISPDEAIYLPYSTAKKYVMGRNISPQITVVADNVKKVPEVIENITMVLNQNFPGTTFTITDAGSKMEAATKSANTLSMLLIAVASIVFIVGGIGIMNVLFVSVKERTREIGILKAIGCSKREILLEFLLESNMISTFGGIVGVGLSLLLMPLMKYTGMRVEPTVYGGVMALLFAIITGTVFGFYPAMKAASLIPIEALSQE